MLMVNAEALSIFLIAMTALGYLLGSIPFGLVLTRMAGLGDIRDIGSGNIGATNVLRTGNKGLALATLLLDGGKAAAAALIGMLLDPYDPTLSLFMGGAAFVGHLFPVWLKFKGGKGVASYFGVLFATMPWVGLVAAITWIGMAFATRYSSLASLITAFMAPMAAYTLGLPNHAIMAGICSVLVVLRHQQNIERLMVGEEPKIGEKKDD